MPDAIQTYTDPMIQGAGGLSDFGGGQMPPQAIAAPVAMAPQPQQQAPQTVDPNAQFVQSQNLINQTAQMSQEQSPFFRTQEQRYADYNQRKMLEGQLAVASQALYTGEHKPHPFAAIAALGMGEFAPTFAKMIRNHDTADARATIARLEPQLAAVNQDIAEGGKAYEEKFKNLTTAATNSRELGTAVDNATKVEAEITKLQQESKWYPYNQDVTNRLKEKQIEALGIQKVLNNLRAPEIKANTVNAQNKASAFPLEQKLKGQELTNAQNTQFAPQRQKLNQDYSVAHNDVVRASGHIDTLMKAEADAESKANVFLAAHQKTLAKPFQDKVETLKKQIDDKRTELKEATSRQQSIMDQRDKLTSSIKQSQSDTSEYTAESLTDLVKKANGGDKAAYQKAIQLQKLYQQGLQNSGISGGASQINGQQ